MAREIASMMFQCGWEPEGPVAYELMSVDNDVRFDATGAPTRSSVSVQAFRLNGTERTPLPVNSQAGAQHYVVLKVASGSSVSAAVTTSIPNANTLRRKDWARFYLIPKTASTHGFTDADVLATCPVQITHDGEDGSNGSFFSTVFVRSPQKPVAPTGGTYTSPYPTSKVTVGTEQRQWTDAPAGGSDTIWISRAIFTPSHTTSSPAWSDPVMAVDSNDVEFIWSTSETSPVLPTTHPFDAANPGAWSKDATDAVWMAVSVKRESVWGDWQMSRIKGEKGEDAVMYRLSLTPSVIAYNLNTLSYETSKVNVR